MIGIFDSGSGGLTVLRAIRDVLPSADILYYGDIGNAPYGTKTRDELSRLTVGALHYLTQHGATSVVSACNSLSASLAVSFLDSFSISTDHLIEMVGPTVSYFKGSNTRVLLVATQATIDSGIYQLGFEMIGKTIDAVAISELAAAIEFGKSESEIAVIIGDALTEVDWEQYDMLVLACTHYPLVMHTFRRLVPSRVVLLDPAVLVAERVEHRFFPRESGNGDTRFVITKDSEPFRRFVGDLFPDTEAHIEVI